MKLTLSPAEIFTIVKIHIRDIYPYSKVKDGKFNITGVDDLSYSIEVDVCDDSGHLEDALRGKGELKRCENCEKLLSLSMSRSGCCPYCGEKVSEIISSPIKEKIKLLKKD